MPHKPNGHFGRRAVLRGMGAAAGAAFTGKMLHIGEALAAGEFKVTMQLGWLASNGILGEVAAAKLGYFADEGLSLKAYPVVPGFAGMRLVPAA